MFRVHWPRIKYFNANLTYRQRLLISTCFSRTYTSLEYEVHASKNHAIISKHLRQFKSALKYMYIWNINLIGIDWLKHFANIKTLESWSTTSKMLIKGFDFPWPFLADSDCSFRSWHQMSDSWPIMIDHWSWSKCLNFLDVVDH